MKALIYLGVKIYQDVWILGIYYVKLTTMDGKIKLLYTTFVAYENG